LPPRESSGATAAGAGIRPRQGTAARQVLPQGHHAGVRHAFARQVSPEARHAGVRHAFARQVSPEARHAGVRHADTVT
jgi:hypothetical protein